MSEPKFAYFIKVYNYLGNLVSDTYNVTSLRYKFSEDDDDLCEVEIETDNRTIADQYMFREGRQLKVQWGWFNGTKSKIRTVYIFDRDTDYKEDGVIQLKLICHERFAVGKMDGVVNKNLTQLKNNAPIVFSSNVIKNIKLAVQKGNTDLNNLLQSNNIILDGLKGGKDYGKNQVLVSYYNGNMSTYYNLRSFLDRLPGGPYVMDSRDDELLIRTRQFGSPSVKSFTYKGEGGELLSFKPITKNRSKKASAEAIDVSTYDPKTKTATNVSAKSKNQTGVKLSNDKTIDIYLPEDGFRSFGKKKPNQPVYVPRSTDILFTSEDIHRALLEDQARAKLAKENQTLKDRDANNLLTAIRKSSKNPISNPYNDFRKNEVDKALVVQTGKIGNSDIQKIFLGTNNGKTYQGGNSRDNTALATNNFALVADQKSLRHNLLSNDTPEKAAALAENKRADAELKNNPGSAELIGQPEIECGQIISIDGVAKIHSGNYYVCDCEHVMSDSEYKLTISSLTRDGISKTHTSKTKKGKKVDLASLIPNNPNLKTNNTIIINHTKGPKDSNPLSTKTVTIKQPGKA